MIIIMLPLICLAILALRFYTHMLQLSSYQFQGYFRFLRGNWVKPLFHLLFIVSVLLAFPIFEVPKGIQLVAAIAICPILISLIIASIPRKAKKKFVVTDRVKRLFITDAVLIIILLVVSFVLYNSSSASPSVDL